jgi:nucleotidyltransferase substrate binding protein (TIGR01987 family)
MKADIRWIQRFDNYKKALKRLNEAVELSKQRDLSLLEKQGLIQAFEFTHELAWKLLKDYLEYQGYQDIKGSRDAIRKAFEVGLIEDGKLWMNSIEARNFTSHAYDESIIEESFKLILQEYIYISLMI